MKQVTYREFYDAIGQQDAVTSIENEYSYPYTSLFKLRNGELLGKVVDSYTDGIKNKYPMVRKYYLSQK